MIPAMKTTTKTSGITLLRLRCRGSTGGSSISVGVTADGSLARYSARSSLSDSAAGTDETCGIDEIAITKECPHPLQVTVLPMNAALTRYSRWHSGYGHRVLTCVSVDIARPPAVPVHMTGLWRIPPSRLPHGMTRLAPSNPRFPEHPVNL